MKLEFTGMKKAAALVCAVGLIGSAFAQTQTQTRTMVTPADSVGAGGKALAALTGVCTSTNKLCYNETNRPLDATSSGAMYDPAWTLALIGTKRCNGSLCGTIQSDGSIVGEFLASYTKLTSVLPVPTGLLQTSVDTGTTCVPGHDSTYNYYVVASSAKPLGIDPTGKSAPTDWVYTPGNINNCWTL